MVIKSIKFKYLINGEWLKGSDPTSASWPKYVKENEPEVGAYY